MLIRWCFSLIWRFAARVLASTATAQALLPVVFCLFKSNSCLERLPLIPLFPVELWSNFQTPSPWSAIQVQDEMRHAAEEEP
ncbi:hypothetical protein B0H14DRAFT_2911357, partial [Mycena olivaceomarginata]